MLEDSFAIYQHKLLLNSPDPFCSLGWYIYEYLVTISSELEFIWQKNTSIVTIIFLINRYASMLGWGISVVVGFLNISNIRVSLHHFICVQQPLLNYM